MMINLVAHNIPGPLSIDLIVPLTRAHFLSTTNSCPSALMSFTVSTLPSSPSAIATRNDSGKGDVKN